MNRLAIKAIIYNLKITRRETRSTSNLLEHICKLYIEKYEQENGPIDLESIIDKK